MAAHRRKKDWFIQERVRALTLVHLTNRKDLSVRPREGEDDPAFVVEIRNDGKQRGLRQFGVAAFGTLRPVSDDEANTNVQMFIHYLSRRAPFPYPMVVFYFTMQDDMARYAWVAEPVVKPNGTFGLKEYRKPACKELSAEALDDIVERIEEWYSAFFQTVTTR